MFRDGNHERDRVDDDRVDELIRYDESAGH